MIWSERLKIRTGRYVFLMTSLKIWSQKSTRWVKHRHSQFKASLMSRVSKPIRQSLGKMRSLWSSIPISTIWRGKIPTWRSNYRAHISFTKVRWHSHLLKLLWIRLMISSKCKRIFKSLRMSFQMLSLRYLHNELEIKFLQAVSNQVGSKPAIRTASCKAFKRKKSLDTLKSHLVNCLMKL